MNHDIENIILDFYLHDDANDYYHLTYDHQKDYTTQVEKGVDITNIYDIKLQFSTYIKQYVGDNNDCIIVIFDINIKLLELLGIFDLNNIHIRDIATFPVINYKHFILHTSTLLDAFFNSLYRGLLKYKDIELNSQDSIEILNRCIKNAGLWYEKIKGNIGYIYIYIIIHIIVIIMLLH